MLQNKSQTVRTAVQNGQPCDRWCGRREHGLRVCLGHSTARDLEPGSAPGWVPPALFIHVFLQTAHLSCYRHCLWSLQCLAGFCIFNCPTQGFHTDPHTSSFLDKCSNCIEVTWSFFQALIVWNYWVSYTLLVFALLNGAYLNPHNDEIRMHTA